MICSIPLNVRAPESASAPATTCSQPNTAKSQTISLPHGWEKRFVARSKGQNKGRVDVYLRPPNGNQLRSMSELLEYLQKHPRFNTMPPSPISTSTTSPRVTTAPIPASPGTTVLTSSRLEIRRVPNTPPAHHAAGCRRAASAARFQTPAPPTSTKNQLYKTPRRPRTSWGGLTQP